MRNKEQIKCPHLRGDQNTYVYNLDENLELWLCPVCNMNLASNVMSQVALAVFSQDFKMIEPKVIKQENFDKEYLYKMDKIVLDEDE